MKESIIDRITSFPTVGRGLWMDRKKGDLVKAGTLAR
jgi:hypothetical protein